MPVLSSLLLDLLGKDIQRYIIKKFFVSVWKKFTSVICTASGHSKTKMVLAFYLEHIGLTETRRVLFVHRSLIIAGYVTAVGLK